MKKSIFLFALPILLSLQIKANNLNQKAMGFITKQTIDNTITSLRDKFGDKQLFRIEKGVNQAAVLWVEKDGSNLDFETFCKENFLGTDVELKSLFEKISTAFEVINGNFNKMSLALKQPLHLDMGDVSPIDDYLGGYEPSAHIFDDFYQNKVGFIIALNFPSYSLQEKRDLGTNWNRYQWALAKAGDLFTSRIPAELLLKASEVTMNADTYIAQYNIMMEKLISSNGKNLFPENLKLITHWGLRDELKSNYNSENGLEKQKTIYEVMKRIISQEIPLNVINNKDYQWNPYTNKVTKDAKEVAFTGEPNTRYQHLLNNFKAQQEIDKYCPLFPTYSKRKFDQEMQLSQEEVEKLFTSFVSSPQVKKVADLINKRLKRKLEPFDIWYDGFKSRSTISEEDLNKKTRALYTNKDAFAKDLPNILVKLGFTKENADFITSKISVDASRGAGHAWGAQMKEDKAHLRTRVGKDGMDYKGYNIAVHEFGHNVEQTITLNKIDYYLLNGVPNTSFTEAIAFLFQQKDLELLGIKNDDINKKYLFALDNFWSAYEIMGVSLVDIEVWKWLYAHPDANAEQLKQAVITISKDVWNKYYAPVFGVKDQTILAIYSHMIDVPLYLSAYPIGHLIDFQIEKYIEGKPFANEIEKILLNGSIIPQLWMKNAVGLEISNQPMLDATDEALKVIK